MLSLDHLVDPLATFDMSLPAEWGMPLGWSLAFLPLFPILLGAVVHLIFGARGVDRVTVSIYNKGEGAWSVYLARGSQGRVDCELGR